MSYDDDVASGRVIQRTKLSFRTGGVSDDLSDANPLPTTTPIIQSGVIGKQRYTLTDLDTRKRITIPAGAKLVEIITVDIAGDALTKRTSAVFNAENTTEADIILADPGHSANHINYVQSPNGATTKAYPFKTDAKCTVIDILSNAGTETGTNIETIVSWVS